IATPRRTRPVRRGALRGRPTPRSKRMLFADEYGNDRNPGRTDVWARLEGADSGGDLLDRADDVQGTGTSLPLPLPLQHGAAASLFHRLQHLVVAQPRHPQGRAPARLVAVGP